MPISMNNVKSYTSDVILVSTVAKMKEMNLMVGCVVKTRGYYEPNDGGGAEYTIHNHTTVDGWGNHYIANGLTARLNPVNGFYGSRQWGGGRGDVTKDTPAVQAMIDAGEEGVYLEPDVEHELLGLYQDGTALTGDAQAGRWVRFKFQGAGMRRSIIAVRGKVMTWNKTGTNPCDGMGTIMEDVGFKIYEDCTDGVVEVRFCRNWHVKNTYVFDTGYEIIGHFIKMPRSYQCSFDGIVGTWHGGAMVEIGGDIEGSVLGEVLDTIVFETTVWHGNYGIFTRSGPSELHNLVFINAKWRDSVMSSENPYGEWEGAAPRVFGNLEHGETWLTADVAAGATSFTVNNAADLKSLGQIDPGNLLYIGIGHNAEQVRVSAVNFTTNTITVDTPFRFAHVADVRSTGFGEPVIHAPVFITMENVYNIVINTMHMERALVGMHLSSVKGMEINNGNFGCRDVMRTFGKCRQINFNSGGISAIHYDQPINLFHVPQYHARFEAAYVDLNMNRITNMPTEVWSNPEIDLRYVHASCAETDWKGAFTYTGGQDVEVMEYDHITIVPEWHRNVFVYMYRDAYLNMKPGQVHGQLITITFNQNYQGGWQLTDVGTNVNLYHPFTLQTAARAYDTITLRWNAVNQLWYEQHRTSTPGI